MMPTKEGGALILNAGMFTELCSNPYHIEKEKETFRTYSQGQSVVVTS